MGRYVVELAEGAAGEAGSSSGSAPSRTVQLTLDFERGGTHRLTIDLDAETAAGSAKL
eukprot:COSAG01_NODE_12015_length_1816_cov_2.577752_2_plen_58_part_00